MRGGTVGWLVNARGVAVVDTQFPARGTRAARGAPVAVEEPRRRPADQHPPSRRPYRRQRRVPRRGEARGRTRHGGPAHAPRTRAAAGGAQPGQAGRPAPGQPGQAGQGPARTGSAAGSAGAAASAAAGSRSREPLYPDTTFTHTWTADVGDERIVARHHGRGHTSGDAVITFERANVVHMGDLAFHQRHPVVDRAAGASMRNWTRLLDQVVDAHARDTIYIFGHANTGLPVTGSSAELLRFRDYLAAVLAFVERQVSARQVARGGARDARAAGRLRAVGAVRPGERARSAHRGVRGGDDGVVTVRAARACAPFRRAMSYGRRETRWSNRAPPNGVVHLALRLGEPAHVLAEQARRVDQRRERRQVARAGVQAQQVEPDSLQRRDALREVRRRRAAPRREHVGVARAGRGERRDARRSPRAPRRPAPRAPRPIAGSSASCSRYAFGSAANSSAAATPSAASVARNTPPPTARERSGAPSCRASHSPARLFQRRSRIPVCHQLADAWSGMNCTSSALLTAPSSIVVSTGTSDPARCRSRFSWIAPEMSSPNVTASQVADATVREPQQPVRSGSPRPRARAPRSRPARAARSRAPSAGRRACVRRGTAGAPG